MASEKKTIAVDFDGVISKYDKWLGRGVFGDPVDGIGALLWLLRAEGWIIIIHTTRSEVDLVKKYLLYHAIPFDHINFNPENVDQGCGLSKPLATVYLDDRAVCFNGDCKKAYNDIVNFKPWYRK